MIFLCICQYFILFFSFSEYLTILFNDITIKKNKLNTSNFHHDKKASKENYFSLLEKD